MDYDIFSWNRKHLSVHTKIPQYSNAQEQYFCLKFHQSGKFMVVWKIEFWARYDKYRRKSHCLFCPQLEGEAAITLLLKSSQIEITGPIYLRNPLKPVMCS